jgi:hypothetical protein
MIRQWSDIFRLLIFAALLNSAYGVEVSIYLEDVSSNISGLADTDLLFAAQESALQTSYNNTSLMPEWMVFQGTNMANSGHLFKGEYGRSVEDLIGVFSIKKVIKLFDNSSCTEGITQWMPCI